eukprot:scaffold2981_cov143-Skeletonema_dohrnii-CCMP3373.AAC.1
MGGPVSECSLWREYSSTFYMATALVIRVSLGVIWWRGAESCSSQTTLLVYMALIVRVASVVLSWEWDGSFTVFLVVRVASASVQLCFGGCGSCTSPAFIKLHAPLWLMMLRYHMSLLWNGLWG